MRHSILLRTFIFILSFLILSAFYGPGIVSSKLLYPFYFYIYGNMGKLVLFMFLSFFIITGKKIFTINLSPLNKMNVFYLIFSIVLIAVFPFLKSNLLKYDTFSENLFLSIITHLTVILIPVLLAFSIFGTDFIKNVIVKFKKELYTCFAVSLVIYFAIFQIWNYWVYLSDIVLHAVKNLFSLTHKNVVVIPPRTLFVEKFAVSIDQACSGLESILLFSGLGFLIWFTERKKIDLKKFSLFFIFGLFGTFLVNILRVYVIIWAGLLLSPQIAATLFHTYLGMVFFLAYFILLLKFTYKRLLHS